ncbi:MAG: DUF1573 domain-containing protein [Thermoanaerobaculia bacterium]
MPDEEWSDREIDRGAALDREVDRLRSVYRDHAETLSKLASTSPSKQLARRYQELIADINKAIVGLDEVDPAVIARKSAEHPIVPPEPAPAAAPAPPASPAAAEQRHEPPERPVLSSTYTASAPAAEGEDGTLLRIAMIIGLAIVLLGVLALFVWKFSGERPPAAETQPAPPPIAAPPPNEEPVTPAPEPKPASSLAVSPQQQDFGVIAKGTSAVRTFEITNTSKSALSLEISRSKCRCLWYDPPKSLPAGGRGTLTIRVDGSRAPAGLLSETVEISGKGHRDAVAVIEITAEVK